jgi:hypothetical protein
MHNLKPDCPDTTSQLGGKCPCGGGILVLLDTLPSIVVRLRLLCFAASGKRPDWPRSLLTLRDPLGPAPG